MCMKLKYDVFVCYTQISPKHERSEKLITRDGKVRGKFCFEKGRGEFPGFILENYDVN